MNRLRREFQKLDEEAAMRKVAKDYEKLRADLAELKEAHELGLCVPCLRRKKEQEAKEGGK